MLAPLLAMSVCNCVSNVSTWADVRPCTITLESAASRWPPSASAPASSAPNAPGDVPSTMPNAASTSRSACARASAKFMPLVFNSVLMRVKASVVSTFTFSTVSVFKFAYELSVAGPSEAAPVTSSVYAPLAVNARNADAYESVGMNAPVADVVYV